MAQWWHATYHGSSHRRSFICQVYKCPKRCLQVAEAESETARWDSCRYPRYLDSPCVTLPVPGFVFVFFLGQHQQRSSYPLTKSCK